MLTRFFLFGALTTCLTAQEEDSLGLSTGDLSHLMGFHIWKFPIHDLFLRMETNCDFHLVVKNRMGKIGRSPIGKYADDSPLVVVIQNAEDIRRDVLFFVMHQKWEVSEVVTKISQDLTDQKLLDEIEIKTVIVDPPVWNKNVLIFYYRPQKAWDVSERPPIFNSELDSYLGIEFIKKTTR